MRPRYAVEQDLNSGQVSKPKIPKKGPGLSEISRERSVSRGEKPDPLINLQGGMQQPIAEEYIQCRHAGYQQGVSLDLIILRGLRGLETAN